jgi:hypothetical protein
MTEAPVCPVCHHLEDALGTLVVDQATAFFPPPKLDHPQLAARGGGAEGVAPGEQ